MLSTSWELLTAFCCQSQVRARRIEGGIKSCFTRNHAAKSKRCMQNTKKK